MSKIKYTRNNNCPPGKERGAVLIISTIFLMVLTLISLNAVDTSTLEEKMSANSLFKHITFQAVETVVRDATSDNTVLAAAITSGLPVTHTISMTNAAITASANITFQGQGIPLGFSLGNNEGSYVANRFSADGTASVSATSAQTTTSQGVTVVGPAL